MVFLIVLCIYSFVFLFVLVLCDCMMLLCSLYGEIKIMYSPCTHREYFGLNDL